MPKLTDLFGETVSTGRDLIASAPVTLAELSGTNVDPEAVQAKVDITNQVIPKVDYSDFENFVFFNSALDYFNISGERTINEYPYDGTYGDILRFVSSSDGYQRHLLGVWPKSNGCVDLTTGSILVTDPLTAIDLSSGEWTVEFHVPAGAPLSLRVLDASGSDVLDIGMSGTSLTASTTSGSIAVASPSSTYYAVVSSVSGSSSAIYGASSGSVFNTLVTGTTLGSVLGNNRFVLRDAPVRELRIWKKARTADELRADWNQRVYANPDLVYYGRYTEGSGSKVRDFSGNSLSGTMASGTWSSATLDMSPQDDGDYVFDLRNPALVSYITAVQASATLHDRNNANLITRLVPAQFITLEDDRQTNVLQNILYLMGRQFDELKVKIDQFVKVFSANYTKFNQTPDALLADALTFWGWTPKGSFLSNDAFEYFFGYNVLSGSSADYDNQRLDTELFAIKNEFWKRTLNNLIYLYKTKGTRESVESLLRIYGLDEHIVQLKEFGTKPDAGIETYRINTQQSAWMARVSASMPPIETVGQPISFISSSAVEMNVRFPSPNDTTMPPTLTTGVICHLFQGTEHRLAQPFAFQLGGPDPSGTTTVEELYYTRPLTGTTGSLWYATYQNAAQQSVTELGNLPIFDGQLYHLMVHKDGDMVHVHVMHLADGHIDLDVETPMVMMSSTLLPGGYDFSIGGGGDAILPTGEFWVNETHVWRTDITDEEMLDHTLNPFSYGTDVPSEQAYLTIRWRLDKDTDAPGVVTDSNPPFINGEAPTNLIYDRYLFDVNYIAPPCYGWNEEKIRFLDEVEDKIGDTFAQSHTVSLEFNLIDALNRDASLLMSSLDNWNNVIGDPANRFRETYPVLDTLRSQYFSRLQGRLNFRVFADFLDFYDRSFIDLVAKLLPARVDFKGGEFVVESHIYERPKVQHPYRRRDVTLVPEGRIIISAPYQTIPTSGSFGVFPYDLPFDLS